MVDSSIFADLSKVNGYMGAVVSDYTGEILVQDGTKVKGIEELSMHFNESFRDIHDTTEKVGVGMTKTMEVVADAGTIIMTCSGKNQRVHLHAFVVLEKGASVGLAKMTLEKVIEKATLGMS